MIALQSVSKQFQHRGKPVVALNHVSLEIAKGDFVAIIGPSGSGKSTFLHLLGGMLSPTEGRVRVENDSLYDLTPEARPALRLVDGTIQSNGEALAFAANTARQCA